MSVITTPEGFKIHEQETGNMRLRTSFAGALIEDLKVFIRITSVMEETTGELHLKLKDNNLGEQLQIQQILAQLSEVGWILSSQLGTMLYLKPDESVSL